MFFKSIVLIVVGFVISESVISESVFGGGGPENVALIVNAESMASKYVANEYIKLRKIPSRNVIYLHDVPEFETTNVDAFRNRILLPLLKEIEKRKLAQQIDYVVYSSDFPTAIDISVDAKKAKIQEEQRKYFRPTAAINSLTFAFQPVLASQPSYMMPTANWYMRLTSEHALRAPLFGEPAQQYNAAVNQFNDGKIKEAKEVFEQLATEHRIQPAIQYWLARCWASEKRADKTTLHLNQAIQMGWPYRDFIEKDTAFTELKDDVVFQTLVNSLPKETKNNLPSRGFRSSYFWNQDGMAVQDPKQGKRFLLSTVLAVTRNRGTTPSEAVAYLKRSVAADGTQPDGKFIFTWTSDPRSTPRRPFFNDTVSALKQLGMSSDIVPATLPKNEPRVAGATIGAATYDWAGTGCKLVPGAIGDNLTSTSGVMSAGGGQTPLSEFLRNGAAGASGAVTEPYNFPFKFPHPFIHVHYVRGCSLAESFYQSVHCPYQLLIVGDALCQPWAKFPKFDVSGLEANSTVSGGIEIKTQVATDSPVPIAAYDLFFDGIRFARVAPKQNIRFDTTNFPDGSHELRIVAIGKTSIEPQSRHIIPFTVDNQKQKIQLNIVGDAKPSLAESIKVRIECDFAEEIQIKHHMRTLATIKAPSTEIEIPCRHFGQGPNQLRAVAVVAEKEIQSAPVSFEVTKD